MARGIERWRYEVDDLDAVYVSQVASKPGRNGVQSIPYGELNLHTKAGRFHLVLQQGAHELTLDPGLIERQLGEQLGEMSPSDAHTALQSFGLHVAHMLSLPCIYDRRMK
jgi:hypothetical protein